VQHFPLLLQVPAVVHEADATQHAPHVDAFVVHAVAWLQLTGMPLSAPASFSAVDEESVALSADVDEDASSSMVESSPVVPDDEPESDVDPEEVASRGAGSSPPPHAKTSVAPNAPKTKSDRVLREPIVPVDHDFVQSSRPKRAVFAS